MQIIPVIDIKDNKVVHAIKGERSNYQEINSVLCTSSDIFAVLAGFLQLADFRNIYIADLNAIMQQGDHDQLLQALSQQFPAINFWLDNGNKALQLQNPASNIIPIIGSESLITNDLPSLNSLNRAWVLSLDHKASSRLGPDELFENERYWPETIILMNLSRVGSSAGPDIEMLRHYKRLYPHKNFVAAGGIRDLRDLKNLEKNAIHLALIASALHQGEIAKQQLKQLRHRVIN